MLLAAQCHMGSKNLQVRDAKEYALKIWLMDGLRRFTWTLTYGRHGLMA